MLANLEANRVGAMPALYRLAGSSPRGARPSRVRMFTVGVVGLGAALALARRRRGIHPSRRRP